MTDPAVVVIPYLVALAFFVVGMVVLFLVVKQAILSALAEDRRRQTAAPLNVRPGEYFERQGHLDHDGL